MEQNLTFKIDDSRVGQLVKNNHTKIIFMKKIQHISESLKHNSSYRANKSFEM